MHAFMELFAHVLQTILHGADRIVFKGALRSLQYAEGAMAFLRRANVRNKDFKPWATERSKQIFADAEALARTQTGHGIERIGSLRERKEAIAHQRQQELGIKRGLIGVWRCQETARTYKSSFNPDGPYPILRPNSPRINHLYFYFDHPVWGFCSVRLQPWFPYGIQLAFNGREFLRRGLEARKIEFIREGNKFLYVGNPEAAQRILDRQYHIEWDPLLSSFLPEVFPAMADIVGPVQSYYWTFWQSEWASDYIFKSPAHLKPLMDNLVKHAFVTGTGDRVMRYFSRPVRLDGQPYSRSHPELLTRIRRWDDGFCIRHWVDGNSIKLYNLFNNLRAETTMNQPGKFSVYRTKQGQDAEAPKARLPLRKGIADATLRCQVSGQINDRFMSQMATLANQTEVREVLDPVTRSFTRDGRRVRALDVLGKDRALLLALTDPKFALGGVSNRQLREVLRGTPWAKGGTDKQLSARISRHLRLLRDHGILRKVENKHRYTLQPKGRQVTSTLHAVLAANTKSLLDAA